MDIKRLALVIGLSFAIFFGWNLLSRQMGWLPPQPLPTEHNAPTPSAGNATVPTYQEGDPAGVRSVSSGDPSASRSPAFMPDGGKPITVETPLYTAIFHSNGGILRQFFLKKYHTSLGTHSPLVNIVSENAALQAPMGLLMNGLPTWTDVSWTLEGEDIVLAPDGAGVLRFTAEIDGVRAIRELRFSGSSYVIDESLRLSSAARKTVNVAFTFGASPLAVNETPSVFSRLWHAVKGGPEPVAEENSYNLTRVAWLQNDKFDEDRLEKELSTGKLIQGKVSWIAVMNNYFMSAVSMKGEDSSAKGSLIGDVYHVLIGKTAVSVSEAETAMECSYFVGPKEARLLDSAPNGLQKALDYGIFSFIAKPMVALLQFFYSYAHNYGTAIVLLTIVIKILFWPLSQKSYKSMQQMKQLQPLIVKIREKYANDKESMNQEIMQLYKTYKVNPAGGCLPILIQIPVFFGLYQALLNAIELRHAPFIPTLPFTDTAWLEDLASPDPLLITPLVMGATMILQQKMTPAPGDPTQAKIMMLMPLVFTVLFINFPSGLVVYWLVNNVISIGQQWMQLRRSV
ncbi:MAG: membrane protein insertase YidC [Desulfovibrio sp.]|jgi:YidC/Oxa1 family membrane protein insertase|nr:membrane protein insertase YidC [Desulfovibrio sp.]